MAAAAYLRVSSGGQTVKAQRRAVELAARARGERIGAGGWFSETASAGRLERPALAALRAAVRAGRFSRVYVFRLDRLTRSGIRDTLALVEEFRRHGAELVSVADGFELGGPAADVVLAVLAWAAQMERRALGERIRAARARVEATGGRWGRPRRLDPTTVAQAEQMRRARPGYSIRKIAAALKVPRSTLADALAGRGHYQRCPSSARRKAR
jgi:DNA invertase Pin-like site-specific DNA recombinase